MKDVAWGFKWQMSRPPATTLEHTLGEVNQAILDDYTTAKVRVHGHMEIVAGIYKAKEPKVLGQKERFVPLKAVRDELAALLIKVKEGKQ